MSRVALLVVLVALASLFYTTRPRATVQRRPPGRAPVERDAPPPAHKPTPAPVLTEVVAPPEPRPPPRVVDADGDVVKDAITQRGPDGWIYAWHPKPHKAVNLIPATVTRTEPVVLPPREAEKEPGVLRGTVLTGDGRPAVGARVRAWYLFRWRVNTHTDENGEFELASIMPALYTVEIHLDGAPTVFQRHIKVGEGATRDLGIVRLPLANRIEIRSEERPIVSLKDVRFNLRRIEGVWITEDLEPGTYLVTLGYGDFREVELQNGRHARIELPRPDSFRVRFETDRIWRLEDEHGHLVVEAQPVELQLVAGRYRLVDGVVVEEFVVSGETVVRTGQ